MNSWLRNLSVYLNMKGHSRLIRAHDQQQAIELPLTMTTMLRRYILESLWEDKTKLKARTFNFTQSTLECVPQVMFLSNNNSSRSSHRNDNSPKKCHSTRRGLQNKQKVHYSISLRMPKISRKRVEVLMIPFVAIMTSMQLWIEPLH